jgi:uncharacterized protein YbjT (DUF2867 family)
MVSEVLGKWLITGANGNLGRRLIVHLLQSTRDDIVAVVRSESALRTLQQLTASAGKLSEADAARVSLVVADYTNVVQLQAAAQGCDRAVHLVGILKATAFATYQAAHEDSCAALVEALAASSVKHITYLSIVGSKASAANACLASKGQAEAILAAGDPSACTLRVPMVLGEGDYASSALRRRATCKNGFVFRGDSLEQPIYAGDVVNGICAASIHQLEGGYDLGGPECLTRKQLYQRGADLFANTPIFVSLPIGLGYLVAGLLEQFLGNPPITSAMLGVLDHDDNIDSAPTMKLLGMEQLTSLDAMLQAVLGSD